MIKTFHAKACGTTGEDRVPHALDLLDTHINSWASTNAEKLISVNPAAATIVDTHVYIMITIHYEPKQPIA